MDHSFELAEALAENTRLRNRIETLEEQATTDPLTGLLNRRGAAAAFERMAHRQGRTGSRLAAVLIDLDHFKRLNDTQGHKAGDDVLRLTGEVIRHHLRATDAGVRWGGEELLVLTENGLNGARLLAERLRLAVMMTAPQFGPEPVTASLGVAERVDHLNLHDLVANADRALYRAKDDGRNRVRTYER